MKLNALFCEHMVLQAEKTVRIFGEGNGIATVKIGEKTVSSRSSKGKWVVEMDPFPYGGPYEVEIALNDQKTIFSDVYFGDVYLLAGQSNIQFKMKEEVGKKTEWKKNKRIRFFKLKSPESYEPTIPEERWVVCTEQAFIGECSAIGYHVACAVNAADDRAVGLIACFQGASVIESWIPEEIVLRSGISKYPVEILHRDHVEPAYAAWNAKPGTLYHFMFEKVVPLVMSHIIWYQGESNTTEAEAACYDDMVVELIKRWRADLKEARLPFVLIQIADYEARCDNGWKLLQAAQARVAEKVNDVKFVVSKDVCENANIHPADKKGLALKIADAVLQN